MNKHYEDAEQEAVIQWSKLARIPGTSLPIGDYLLAIPNGGKRNLLEAVRLKRQGVLAGVSDLFLAYPSASIHGLWIEMKKQRRHYPSLSYAERAPTPQQKDWIKRMESVGYMGKVCYGAGEAIGVIKMFDQELLRPG